MKKFSSFLISVLFICSCFSYLALTALAEGEVTEEPSAKIPSNPLAEPVFDIENVIKEKITEEIIRERYNMFSAGQPEEYTVGTSAYLLEYNVSSDYWESITAFDYEGLTEKIDYRYPTVYIPVFGDIADSKGIVHNRVIGYIKLYYNPTENDYRFNTALYNLKSSNYKDKLINPIYEDIANYLEQNKVDARQVFLIRNAGSFTNEQGKVAVIQTQTDTVILDVTNTLQTDPDIKVPDIPKAYSISNYRTLHSEVATGTNHDTAKENSLWSSFVPYGVVVAVLLAVTAFFVLKKYRKV